MFNSNDYPKDKAYRAQAMRNAERRHLAHLAHPHSEHHIEFNLSEHKQMIIVVVSVLFLLFLLALTQTTRAQDLNDAGTIDPFADAILAYRVGYYFYTQGDYERATSELKTAIREIPDVIFTVSVDYATMYWTLGDAQFMAAQFDEALASYQQYLDLVGSQASSEAAAYVDTLSAAITNGTTSTITLFGG